MKVAFELTGKVLCVIPQGDMDQHSSSELRDKIDARVKKEKGVELLVFDFEKVSFMDSSGIGVILGRYKLMCARGGKLSIKNASKSIEKLLKMSGIYSLSGYERRAK